MHFQAGKYFLSTGVEVFLEMTALIEVVYTPVSDTPPPTHLNHYLLTGPLLGRAESIIRHKPSGIYLAYHP